MFWVVKTISLRTSRFQNHWILQTVQQNRKKSCAKVGTKIQIRTSPRDRLDSACLTHWQLGSESTWRWIILSQACEKIFCNFKRHHLAIYNISTQQNRCNIICSGRNRHRSKSAQVKIGPEKNELTLLYSALIKKKSVSEVNSFAFNGNSLHWEHDCIFTLPLRSSVDHYYKQVISAQSQ